MDKIKTLSQAIRLGSTFHPQCFSQYVKFNEKREIIETCALGAALDSSGARQPFCQLRATERFRDVPYEIFAAIVLKNDQLRMSREAIADWVEQQGY